MMTPFGDMVSMATQMMGCCSLIGVMPWLISMVTPPIAVGAVVYLLAKPPETRANQEFSR